MPPPPILVGKGGHTLPLLGRRRGFVAAAATVAETVLCHSGLANLVSGSNDQCRRPLVQIESAKPDVLAT